MIAIGTGLSCEKTTADDKLNYNVGMEIHCDQYLRYGCNYADPMLIW